MIQYINKLQATLKHYNAQEEASFIVPRIREEAFIETSKTRMEAFHTQSKGKAKVEDEESLNEAPKDIDWKLICVEQRYQKK